MAARRERRRQQPLGPESAVDCPVFGAGLTRDGRSGSAVQGARIGPKAARWTANPASPVIRVAASCGPQVHFRCHCQPGTTSLATVHAVCARPRDRAARASHKQGAFGAGEVAASIDDPRPSIPHDLVMADREADLAALPD
ncbi:hypothetical protein [Roseospira navarrensis]|uniref:antitoxin PaaA2 family protein n=1 Tax=Roseospira navarrensis TaxID=140058 RepID=UPI003CCD79B6